jgi:hypothetical protein
VPKLLPPDEPVLGGKAGRWLMPSLLALPMPGLEGCCASGAAGFGGDIAGFGAAEVAAAGVFAAVDFADDRFAVDLRAVVLLAVVLRAAGLRDAVLALRAVERRAVDERPAVLRADDFLPADLRAEVLRAEVLRAEVLRAELFFAARLVLLRAELFFAAARLVLLRAADFVLRFAAPVLRAVGRLAPALLRAPFFLAVRFFPVVFVAIALLRSDLSLHATTDAAVHARITLHRSKLAVQPNESIVFWSIRRRQVKVIPRRRRFEAVLSAILAARALPAERAMQDPPELPAGWFPCPCDGESPDRHGAP